VSSFLEELTGQLNLRWAWEKVRREAKPGDIWFDEVELAGFELELEKNLESIAAEFKKGRYKLTVLRPLPFPKQPDKQGNQRVRQTFQIAIRDQVAWTAVVNVVGPHVDIKIPNWSYGNRLYRSIWVDEDEGGIKRRKIGSYRHASGHLYLPFAQSWPIFRRHIFLATQAMTKNIITHAMDEQTSDELLLQETLNPNLRCPFTSSDYWERRRPEKEIQILYWCSIDLENFYPTLRLEVIQKNIVEQLPIAWQTQASRLLKSMLAFQLNTEEWTKEDLKGIGIKKNQNSFLSVPTGLYTAGFLANAGLLKVNLQVVELLEKRNIAHFQFVDDHVVLAYSMQELIDWVKEYENLLKEANTGVRINPEKIEPAELAILFKKDKKKSGKRVLDKAHLAAEEKCSLDPEFPSPLMTKTLALVSTISRTDFNLLDSNELAALTEQLEHLLLVDLPEEEMPEKTRLSFAASRLTRIAECRIANDETIPILELELESLNDQSPKKDSIPDELNNKIKIKNKELEDAKDKLNRDVNSAFQLLRKVLREKPERIRLWTRAVLMCRLTGVLGLKDLWEDVDRIQGKNPLAAEAIRANIFVLLGTQAFTAARISQDLEVAQWRKDAAFSFLRDIVDTEMLKPKAESHWFLHMSWQQYCFGLQCAGLILSDQASVSQFDNSLSKKLLSIGKQFDNKNASKTYTHSFPQWAWWAARMTLRDLNTRAHYLVKVLGKALEPSRETVAFWKFFPLDVPAETLISLLKDCYASKESNLRAGWWLDAFRNQNKKENAAFLFESTNEAVKRVQRNLNKSSNDSISLYDWCDELQKLKRNSDVDPRCGEWTALEIARQVGVMACEEPVLNVSYLKKSKKTGRHFFCIHPANIRVPKSWIGEKEITWEEWKGMMLKKSISCVSKAEWIMDDRYTPIKKDNFFFESINLVRGLGLLLYGLLKKNFDLPSIWNGHGHADILTMLPKMLLTDMTCSSWTIGILEGCLQPRATENRLLTTRELIQDIPVDNDTIHDPLAFESAAQVVSAINKCQEILVNSQLSTLDHKARQLTPVNITQLTSPEWSKVFEEGDEHA